MAGAGATSNALDNGSIAIGGVGGSGTRVVAAILQHAGIDLGSDLNDSRDLAWFTLLFRRPDWYERHARRSNGGAIRDALDVFHRAMTGTIKVGPKSIRVLASAVAGPGRWSANTRSRVVYAHRMLQADGPSASAIGWGWKEPNTHIYLPTMCEQFGDLRYIHVIRHGLDMALSSNQNQVQLWGSLLVGDDALVDDPVRRSLQYWYVANQRAISAGEAIGDRFMLLNYDELCARPRPTVARLLEFARAPHDDAAIASGAALVDRPSTIGRYQSSLSQFTDDDIASVRELGFDVSSAR